MEVLCQKLKNARGTWSPVERLSTLANFRLSPGACKDPFTVTDRQQGSDTPDESIFKWRFLTIGQRDHPQILDQATRSCSERQAFTTFVNR